MRLFEGTPFDRPPHCERCDRLESECQCPPVAREVKRPQSQTAKLSCEKRKKGKLVTVVRGLTAENNDLDQLVKKLKNGCGAGGHVEGNEIEIQGDQIQRVRELLQELGYKVQAPTA